MTLIAVCTLGLGTFMIIAPGSFHDTIGPFGPRNDHYAIDGATFYLAFGLGAVVAIRDAGWRIPVLAMLAVQNVAHTINHLVDIGDATPSWVGIFDFVVLMGATVLLSWLLLRRSTPTRCAS
ncbi:MAG: hypothetical protein ACRDSR_22500 [Pseudonocardiaceae bacterium]